MRSIRPGAAAGAVALALMGTTAFAQYGPPPGMAPYGAPQPYGQPPPGPYLPGAYGPAPYGVAPGLPPAANPYGAYASDPSLAGLQGMPPAAPGASASGAYPTDPSQAQQPETQQQAATAGTNPYVGPPQGSGAPLALPSSPGGAAPASSPAAAGAPTAAQQPATAGGPSAQPPPGAPGGPGVPAANVPGMPPVANLPGQAPGSSLGQPPSNMGAMAQIGPSGVPSASSVSQYANLPLPPTAGGVSTDTIRFVAVGDSSYAFDPSPVRIPVQQPITWVNTSSSIIQIVSEDGNSFDSGALAPGESFSFTPTLVGSMPYRDKLHPSVRGVLVATSSNGR